MMNWTGWVKDGIATNGSHTWTEVLWDGDFTSTTSNTLDVEIVWVTDDKDDGDEGTAGVPAKV